MPKQTYSSIAKAAKVTTSYIWGIEGPFVPHALTASRILFVGEAPGSDEETVLTPFAGASGYLLNDMLRQAGGLSRDHVSLANVVNFRPPNNDIEHFVTRNKKRAQREDLTWSDRLRAYVAPFVHEHLDILNDTIRKTQPNVIVALGNTALLALTGESGVVSWRGSILESKLRRIGDTPYKVIPTYHPAAILRQYSWKWVATQDLRKVIREAASPDIEYPKYNFTIRPNYQTTTQYLEWYLTKLEEGPFELSVDIETSRRQISCIGFAHSTTDAICIPFFDRSLPDGNYWPHEEQEVAVVKLIRKVLTHPNCRVIGQNFDYDKVYTGRTWFTLPPTAIDTCTYHHVSFPLLPKKISFQASLFCKYYRYWKEEGKTKEDKKDWGAKTPPEKLWTYNCKDCVITYEVAQVQKSNASKLGMTRPIVTLADGSRLSPVEFEMALSQPTVQMTMLGVNIDQSERRRLSKEMEQHISGMQTRLNYLVGHNINPRSTPQLRALIYDDMQVKPVIDKKTQRPTLNSEAIDIIRRRQPIAGTLLDIVEGIRSATIFNSTFLKAPLLNGRFHCTYDRDGTNTFRFSSRKDPMQYGTNSQNIPKGGGELAKEVLRLGGETSLEKLVASTGIKEDKLRKSLLKEEDNGFIALRMPTENWLVTYLYSLPNIRKMFIPDPGFVFGDWDLDRADLQVVAWEACQFDPQGPTMELKRMLREGVDLHSEHARILDCSRDMAKIFIHGTNYGGKAATMAAHCGITTHQASRMQARWFSARPGIKRWHEDTEAQIMATRTITSKFGFRIFYLDRPESVVSKALAWKPQHTVAVVINTGLLNLYRFAKQIIPILQVHDSLGLMARRDDATRDDVVRRMLTVTVPYDDPLIIPVSGHWSDTSWAECKAA